MRTKTSKTIVAMLVFVVTAAFATATFADEMKLPMTPAEHEAMAKSYKEQAAQYKKVADDHRAMAEAYKKAHPDAKGGATDVALPRSVPRDAQCVVPVQPRSDDSDATSSAGSMGLATCIWKPADRARTRSSLRA